MLPAPLTASGANEDADAAQPMLHADLLPNETLAAIFSFLAPSEIVTLTCASRRFNAVAERILYASIAISDTLDDAQVLPYRTLRFCDAILRRGHLHDVVKHLGVRWHAAENCDKASVAQPLRDVGCWRLRAALRTLPALESLELLLGPANLGPDANMHAIEITIHECALPHLRYCSFGTEWAKDARPYGPVLDAFLGACAGALHHLKLYDHRGVVNVPPGIFPQLVSFRGYANAAASLLPSNGVTYLALTGQDSDVTRENLPRMALGRVPLRYLDLAGMSVRPVLLRSVAECFPALEGIKIRLALRHTLHYAMSGIRLLSALSSVLSSFPSLTYLDLSPTGVDQAAQSSAEEELCSQWQQACPTLRTIVFPSETQWVLGNNGSWGIAQ
ncbi:hypothetical protein HDZ31DRAFT_66263 [Schizophyllum fasciatum]